MYLVKGERLGSSAGQAVSLLVYLVDLDAVVTAPVDDVRLAVGTPGHMRGVVILHINSH